MILLFMLPFKMLVVLELAAINTFCNRYTAQTTTPSGFGTSVNGWQPLRP
jgi:hypothetical protein